MALKVWLNQVVRDHAYMFRKLETQNESLKLLLAEKELEFRLKDDLIKMESKTEKEVLVRPYINLGMRRNQCLPIS
jgi:hypothetical protein